MRKCFPELVPAQPSLLYFLPGVYGISNFSCIDLHSVCVQFGVCVREKQNVCVYLPFSPNNHLLWFSTWNRHKIEHFSMFYFYLSIVHMSLTAAFKSWIIFFISKEKIFFKMKIALLSLFLELICINIKTKYLKFRKIVVSDFTS